MAVRPNHRQEWLDSGVDETIIDLNVRSLSKETPYEYLLYGLGNSERLNTGRLKNYWLRKYQHVEAGGWWCNGIDLLTGQGSQWGCFKPDSPRLDKHVR
ncbi:MAG: hypothetical protein ACRC2R_25980, partial [Xenococcaceae cyanobacterium]